MINTKHILETPHALIVGSTGCGKSVLINHVICDALDLGPQIGELYLIDLKRGVEFCEYAGLPQVSRFCIDADQAISALDDAIEAMDRRLDAMRLARKKVYPGRQIWIVIDELAFLLQTARKKAVPRLTEISQRGRAAGIHLIMGTQNPSRSEKGGGIPAEIQANMTMRIGLHCSTAIESRQAIGQTGCEDLPKHGRCFVWEEGFIRRESIDMISEARKAAAIGRWSRVRMAR